MDRSIAGLLFRQLFARCTCKRPLAQSLPASSPQSSHLRIQRRAASSERNDNTKVPALSQTKSKQKSETSLDTWKDREKEGGKLGKWKSTEDFLDVDTWQHRRDVLPAHREGAFRHYGMTTAEELRLKNRRPKRTKMLMRDFIEDSLYNPSYGYFSKHAVIFDPGAPFDFNAMRDEAEFYRQLGERYTVFEDKLDEQEHNDTRQLWHTPTELFRPYYAESIARYMISNYKLSNFPYHDLIIYELGAGNGTFMLNVLDYIRDTDPEVYARTQYKIIEISSSLALLQSNKVNSVARTLSGGHADKVEIINRSIFNWDTYVATPCFVLALEVIDNFAHDVVRYDPKTERPMQSTVMVDADGEFYQFWSPLLDPVAGRFFRVREAACELPVTHPLRWSRVKRAIRGRLPFAPNMSDPEWIPTRLMQFFDVLHNYFPAHKLVISDFHSLPGTVPGFNAPLVQTRFQRRTVPVTTPLCHQGYFDIMFPTDFNVMEALYRAITGKFTRVMTHEEYMQRWAYVQDTETRNGENPLLSWYQNASFMVTI